MPTKMELTLEQTQQGVSYEVLNIRVISITIKMEILLEPTSNKLIVEHAEFDESDTYVLERFDTSAGNPVNEILLKLNLPDHTSQSSRIQRIFKDGGEGTGLKYHPLENDKDLYKLMDSGQFAAKLFVNGGTPFIRNTGHDNDESIINTSNSTHIVDKASDQMRNLVVSSSFTLYVRPCGTTRFEELVIYQGTTLTNLKLLVAKLFSLDHETVTLQYRVPFQGRTYAALEDDKDVDNMIQSCIETSLQVFVFGTPVDVKTSAAAKRKAYSLENELDPVGEVDKKRKRVTTTKGKAHSQAN
ncbi:hypothetical protein Tco_0536234 [Tanacetum coccineum]